MFVTLETTEWSNIGTDSIMSGITEVVNVLFC